MKKGYFFILVLLLMVMATRAQDLSDPGWHFAYGNDVIDPTTFGTNQAQQNGIFQPSLQTFPSVAETITPEIQALARGLQNDPVKIYNYVHDHIRPVFYFGSKKGAELTLLEKSGNDFDQCSLLVALLRAAGYSPTYEFGLAAMPYDATDGTHNDLHHWLQLSLVNTNFSHTLTYFSYLIGTRGYPAIVNYGDNNTLGIQREWVLLPIGGTNYLLDPGFKVSEPVTNLFNVSAAMNVTSNSIMSAVGGSVVGNYATNLSEANLRGALTGYTTNLLNYIQSNAPNASVQQILGGWRIVPATSASLSTSLLFIIDTQNSKISDWSNEPTNFMATLQVNFARTNYLWYMPQFQGQRLSLFYSTNGAAQLWQDDALLVTNTTTASDTNVVLTVNQPFGVWDFANNVLVPDGRDDYSVTNAFQRTNAVYVITYAFEPDWGWLSERQRQLDGYIQQGLPSTSRQIVSETLNIMQLSWMLQCDGVDRIFAGQFATLPQYHNRFGRAAQENGNGYYIDAYMELSGEITGAGTDPGSLNSQFQEFDLSTYFSSALEHGIIEQLQGTNHVAASTVKMLQLGCTNGKAIFLASSANWSTVQTKLQGYNSATLSMINTKFITQGYSVLLPQSGTNQIAGPGSWGGYGMVTRFQNSTNESMGMVIAGNYNGGYSDFKTELADINATVVTEDSQSDSFDGASAFTSQPTGADPVDMANGTFQVEHTDLSVGQAEPRGIALSRYYNGTRRNSNPAGMAAGWIHNYDCVANTVSAPQVSLGGSTPQQMTPIIAAAFAVSTIYGTTPDPRNWTTAALISKWGVDQLYKNSVSFALGKDTVQFIKQPNGAFTPPGNCTMTITTNGLGYNLLQRHGNTFQFDFLGRLTNIVDQYFQSVSLTYNTSNLVSTVTDWKRNRTFTFSYTGNQLTSISDNSTPSRTIHYGYSSTSAQADLTSFTDAEGKLTTYGYDTNHEIITAQDALSRLVVSNIYDGFGHIATQFTEGDTNKAWQVFWSGWQTVVQDPTGSKQSYFYDGETRVIGRQDALGNLTQMVYDGQSHLVESVSPLSETNLYLYDANNNVTNSIDPLGFTNQFIYDGQNRLMASIDPRGNVTTYGYNSQFSITGQTNGAGDFVNYTYNADGTTQNRTDSAGTTSYGYDANGQLNSITYPSGLGSESFTNDIAGDPTSHKDANGNVTTFGYNNRRELTNTVSPTNLTVSVAFDAADNVATTTDARGNSINNTWSATRQLLATTWPTTPQGVPVMTNIYDSRDWLIEKLDPLKNGSIHTNDPDGRLVSSTDPVLRTTTYTYDANSRKLATVNAASETNSQAWDARGSLLRLTDGAGHFSARVYDVAGNQVTLTNRNGKKWQFQFDAANRLTNTITPLGYSTACSFNHQGLVASIKDQASQPTSFYYDAKRRLTNRTDNVATTLYSYDANDNRTNMTENGKINSWTFDAYNRVSSYRDTSGNVIQYRYDANGNMTNLIYPGGKNVSYAYDSLNRMTNVSDWSGRQTRIGYDLDSRISSILRPNGTYRTINYDAAGQATNILEQTALGFPIAMFMCNWTNSGTMAWEFAAPLPHNTNLPPRLMTYDADNRLASFQGPTMGGYQNVGSDADGNLTNAPLTNDTFVAYAYDARNRLTSVGGVTNVYDAMNNRIGQNFGTNNTAFVLNPNAKLPQVLMRIKNSVTNYYIYGAGLLYQITETATGTNTLTYHYDYRGSTVAISDDSGNVTDRIEYSLYGTLTYRVGTNDTPFLFNGRYGVQTDPDGLLYMQARYYNPYLCRFLNPDPSGFGGGLNFYAYADGNPVSYLDPFGLGAIGESGFSTWIGNAVNAIGNALLNGLGYVWNVPNTIIGLAFGTVGYASGWAAYAMGVQNEQPAISLGHNGIQFENNPFMFGQGDITFGNAMNFATPGKDYDGNTLYWGPNDHVPLDSPFTNGDHEEQHTIQGMILGPLFLPAYGIGMINELINPGRWGAYGVMGPGNFMEAGPYYPETHNPPLHPQPWP